MNKLHIVTVATHNEGYYNILVDSCKRLDLNLITLGLNKKWTGFTMRFSLWLKYLEKLNNNDIVLFIDAYDVFFLEGKNEILTKYYNFRKPIIFGIQNGFLTNMFMNTCNNNNLNMGAYIGSVKYLKKLLNIIYQPKLFNKFGNDDQLILNYICQNNKSFFNTYVALDINKDIFYITNVDTLLNYKYLLFKDIGLIQKNGKLLKKDNKQPSIVHLASSINGNKYITYLKYNINKITFKNPFLNILKTKQALNYCGFFLQKIFLKLLLLLLLLYLFLKSFYP